MTAGAIRGDGGGPRRAEILDAASKMIAAAGLRTTLQEIADAVGILPGSIYHHFRTKDALLVELLQNYHRELDEAAAAAETRQRRFPSHDSEERILALTSEIAGVASRNMAAVSMSIFQAPSDSAELTALIQEPPTTMQKAMLSALRSGRRRGEIRTDVHLEIFASRICHAVLSGAVEAPRHDVPADVVAAVLGRILLHGLANRPLTDTQLDDSSAFAAADECVAGWTDATARLPIDREADVRAAARREFGSRGYEYTTVRDIAAAAGVGTRTVYRLLGSKEDVLHSIMTAFNERIDAAWDGVVQSRSSVIEKLDALSWLNINALQHFPDEFRIQVAWMRQQPPDVPDPSPSYVGRLDDVQQLLADGLKCGEIRSDSLSLKTLARCVIAIQWIPASMLAVLGTRGSLLHLRGTVLHGAMSRPPTVQRRQSR